MSAFEQLDPALQHHIVNSLGWKELRPFQEAAIPHLLSGQHALVLAPTAGGKTEGAVFPVLSRMLSEGWKGLSVLYLCPIKALLNNLEHRLQSYCGMLGRRAALWHGDIGSSARLAQVRDPAEVLLTTPESLEVMLVSQDRRRRDMLRSVRVVIVDEIHAFAGDDRGWHLISVLERLARSLPQPPQRIGLSATVGNPDDLLTWLVGTDPGEGRVLVPPPSADVPADVTVDHVDKLENAATVISRMHRGEKRLVFIDSRSRVETLGARLRELGVKTHVTHSSLSPEERARAEQAFAEDTDCVIVATSALELGIDVGDLDRVIQIDSPPTVSSFLQRMGRTGRRAGSRRNCLFLTTSDDAALQAAGLVELWSEGFIEPVRPPPFPIHVLTQQLMAITLAERGIGRSVVREILESLSSFKDFPAGTVDALIDHMLAEDLLWEDSGILWFGRRGEEEFGQKHFLEVLSVITSEPLIWVLHGRKDLGFVHPFSLQGEGGKPTILLLAGRSWLVNHIDWDNRIAYVEPSEVRGKSLWIGGQRPLSLELCQAMKRSLLRTEPHPTWSARMQAAMETARAEMPWLTADATHIESHPGNLIWWTFAGALANGTLAHALQTKLGTDLTHDNLSISSRESLPLANFLVAWREVRAQDPTTLKPPVPDDLIDSVKFSAAVPRELCQRMLESRMGDGSALRLLQLAETVALRAGD